jgi:LDH2 family malate/lactate/ureidoglycolate dehydrogenase
MSQLIDLMKALPPVDPEKPVLVPGEPELARQNLADKQGVSLHENIFAALVDLAKTLNIPPPQAKAKL